MGIRLHVWGDYACFTRPEMKVERVSYDVITPSAARGILEAIHWKPAIRWQIDRIHVLRPIRFQSFRRNEVGAKISAATAASAMKRGTVEGLGMVVEDHRQQRATQALIKVAYVIEAHFTLTEHAGPEDSAAKHAAMFNRRASLGQCFHRPCFGTREFPLEFDLIPEGAPLPPCKLPDNRRDEDFGWMLHDIDFAQGRVARFYHAVMAGGVIDVQACLKRGTRQ